MTKFIEIHIVYFNNIRLKEPQTWIINTGDIKVLQNTERGVKIVLQASKPTMITCTESYEWFKAKLSI